MSLIRDVLSISGSLLFWATVQFASSKTQISSNLQTCWIIKTSEWVLATSEIKTVLKPVIFNIPTKQLVTCPGTLHLSCYESDLEVNQDNFILPGTFYTHATYFLGIYILYTVIYVFSIISNYMCIISIVHIDTLLKFYYLFSRLLCLRFCPCA